MMGEKTAWRGTLEGSRQDMGTDRLWGDRQEGRLMPWSLAQDGVAVPGQGTAAACGFRWRWDECLFPPCRVRERISELMLEKGLLVHSKRSIML